MNRYDDLQRQIRIDKMMAEVDDNPVYNCLLPGCFILFIIAILVGLLYIFL
jgi:hypothetical protein